MEMIKNGAARIGASKGVIIVQGPSKQQQQQKKEGDTPHATTQCTRMGCSWCVVAVGGVLCVVAAAVIFRGYMYHSNKTS